MSQSLAVFTSQVGASFINRHVDDLMPGRTSVIVRNSGQPLGGSWKRSCPVLALDRWQLRMSVRLGRRTGVSVEWMRNKAVRRFLRRHRVSVVLGEFLDQFLDFVPLLDRMQLPYVVQGHGIDLSAALRKPGMAQKYLAYRSARAILTRCNFHRQRLIELGLPPARIHVNFGGVDIPSSRPERPADAADRFLAIGANAPKKGPIYLLEAFRLAAAENPVIRLDYVGAGPLLPAVRQFVAASGLQARVRVHGAVSTEVKLRLLQECGVFVQHSVTDPETGDEEGLPAAIQEAMAHAMPVVSTRHAGIPEAVQESVTGLLVDEGDVKGMAAAMLAIHSSAAAFGSTAYLLAKAEHSWECERRRLLHCLS